MSKLQAPPASKSLSAKSSNKELRTNTESMGVLTKSATKPEETSGAVGKDPVEPAQENPSSPGQNDTKPKKKRLSANKRKPKPGKIHIRLPPIEAYQKDLCFAAEAPGRVVVRLERLMGSDKIRPVDGKYMETLIQRLEDEEKIAWDKRIKLRKKAEKERYRRLAISGLMEPGPGMEDLFNHPVFRVNRILNRLSSLDNTFSHNPALKLPPIVQINPFEKDDTGAFFKDYPFHRALRKEWEQYKPMSTVNVDAAKTEEVGTDEAVSFRDLARKSLWEARSGGVSATQSTATPVQSTATAAQSKTSVPKLSGPPSDLEEEDEFDEELYQEEEVPPQSATESETEMEESEQEEEFNEIEEAARESNQQYVVSLKALMEKYGVPEDEEPGFEEEWKPFSSNIVESFAKDFDTSNDMFEGARDVFDLFTRQAIVVQDHVDATSGVPKVKSSTRNKKKLKIAMPGKSQSGTVAPSSAESGAMLEEDMADDEEEDEENEGGEEEINSEVAGTGETVVSNIGLGNEGEEEEGEIVENSETVQENEAEAEPIPVETDQEEEETEG